MLFSGVYVLWEDPLIVSCLVGAERHALAVRAPADILLHPAWLPTTRTLPSLFGFRFQASRKGKRAHFMCCSADADRLLRRFHFPGALVNISSYINDRAFTIRAGSKRYDAIYPARMERYKRMYLAAKVPRLFIQTYGPHRTSDGLYDLHRFEPRVAHCDFNRTAVSTDELVINYSAARVALALSKCEGAMLGSVEAMLCGLPLVSTPCRGGREQFFDDRYVGIVDATPEAVAAGVAEVASRNIDPQVVRAETLAKLSDHRAHLADYVIQIIRKRGSPAPSRASVVDRLFGGPQGALGCYVHRTQFQDRGW